MEHHDGDRRFLSMTVLMTPDMANFSGKVHGGDLLNLLDRVAFASRCSCVYAVTLSVDQVVSTNQSKWGNWSLSARR